MAVEIFNNKKNEWIKFFREHGFNCFPLPRLKKEGDYRYVADRKTPLNQKISPEENYGIIPILENGNAIIDVDNKERYRNFIELMIKEKYVVSETGRGWHIPVINLTGEIEKVFLFDYNFQPNNSIIEVLSSKQYCVGIGSTIFHDKLKKTITYESRGGKRIWDAKGKNIEIFVDELCEKLSVERPRKNNPSGYKHLRDQFIKGKIPNKNQSNDYFHEASRVCLTKNLSEDEAIEKIKIIYDEWKKSKFFSGRSFSNIMVKVKEVYDDPDKFIIRVGRKAGTSEKIDRTGLATSLNETRKIYSDVETHEIFENKNGFLEKLNHTLKRELVSDNPEIEKADYEAVLFKLEGLAMRLPPTNKDLIVFKNGVYSKKAHTTIETEDLADMGFNDFNYLTKTKINEPKEYLKVLFSNVPKYQHPRIKAGLKAIFNNRMDSRISVIHGLSGVGKSTPLTILAKVLENEYAFVVELNLFLEDRATRAKIKGKRLLVFQDLPKEWKDFTSLKTLTGELLKTERGFQQDSSTFDNKLKIWASGNYLADIPEIEKDAMYTRRLSLINNTRIKPYKEDSAFADKITEEEGEKIISWIVNLTDEECEYEDKATIQTEWEGIASPEIKYLNHNYQTSGDESNKPIMEIIKECHKSTSHNVSLKQMLKSMRSLGYVIKNNTITNIEPILQDNTNQKLAV